MTNKIRIEGDGYPRNTHIYLDGQEIGSFVIGLQLIIGNENIPHVHLDCVGHLELPDELEAIVTATKVQAELEAGE